MSITKIVH